MFLHFLFLISFLFQKKHFPHENHLNLTGHGGKQLKNLNTLKYIITYLRGEVDSLSFSKNFNDNISFELLPPSERQVLYDFIKSKAIPLIIRNFKNNHSHLAKAFNRSQFKELYIPYITRDIIRPNKIKGKSNKTSDDVYFIESHNYGLGGCANSGKQDPVKYKNNFNHTFKPHLECSKMTYNSELRLNSFANKIRYNSKIIYQGALGGKV